MPPSLPNNKPGGGPTGRQLAQPPPQAGASGAPTTEDASVAAIIRDGEANFQSQMGHWRPSTNPLIESLVKEAELTWIAAGSASESLGEYDRALECFERALKHDPLSVQALTKAAGIYRHQENFKAAANYFCRLLKIHENSGEIWGALGHCYLMLDALPRAYTSYQQALHHFPTPKSEPKLWYGIGILYDRYGSLEHAEEAFSSVILMDRHFEKANEIYFRLGIIYKQQGKADLSLDCFQWILDKPPSPLTEIDIWFQIGHVHEQQGNFDQAKEAYLRVLSENANHAKVLQQLGGLYCREGSSFYDTSEAVKILTRSVQADRGDPFTWYLLARVYMTQQNYTKAYESYQQAVYRDGKNPAFWCSIGVLYYAICQYHDSLDAYSRAIRINPYLSEVWFNLGALYESCNDQMPDAIDAYQRAIQLDSNNAHIQRRLEEIRLHQETGAKLGPPPLPRDMNHTSPNWPFPNVLSGSSEASGFGHSMIVHDETSRPCITSPGSPHSTRPISPGGPPARSSIPRPGTSNSASGMRPQSAGPFAHAPPPSLQTSHHTMGHSGHSLPPAQQHVPQSATLDRRQSGGHGPLAPMEFEPSPRLGTRGAPSAQHNLPHIRSVVDSHSRGPSPAPSASEAMRRPMSISGQGPGHRDVISPRTSPSIHSNIPPTDRVQYSSGSNGVSRPPAHHGPPQFYSRYPQSAVPADETQPPPTQPPVGGGGSMGRDRERSLRDSNRPRPHSPDFRLANADRDARPPAAPTSSAMYAHRGVDHPGVNCLVPSQPQPQSPYDPRHASPGLRAATGPPRYEPDQSSLASPSWPATDHRVGPSTTATASPAVSPEERRPGSRSGYASQNYPSGNMPPHHISSHQHAPSVRRYDPRYDETTVSSHRPSLSHDQVSPPRPRSHNEEERQKAMSVGRQGQPSPTPSVAASEFTASGTGSGIPRRTARAKQNNKEDDYPSANHARRRKLPISRSNTLANPAGSTVLTSNHVGSVSQLAAFPPTSVQTPTVREGSQVREKKEKKKVANTKVRPAAMKTKVNETSKRHSPSPIPLPNPMYPASNLGLQSTSPPPLVNPSMPDRKVDEEFEEYDEVADALLSFAGQPPRRGPAPHQPSPTDQSPHSAPVSTGGRSAAAKVTSSSRSVRGSNGISPRSEGGLGIGSGEGRSPSSSSHSVAQRSAIESPVRAGSSPESTLVQSYASQRFHPQHHGNNSSPNPASTTSMNGATTTSVAQAIPPPKRVRGDGSSPTDGDSCPEPKRSRSSVGRSSKGKPSPRSQSNSDTRSPLSANVSNAAPNIMSLVGGKKSIMNEDSVPDHLPNDAIILSCRRASEGSTGNSTKLDEEIRDDNPPESSERVEDPQHRHGPHDDVDEDADMGEPEEEHAVQDNNVEGATAQDEKTIPR